MMESIMHIKRHLYCIGLFSNKEFICLSIYHILQALRIRVKANGRGLDQLAKVSERVARVQEGLDPYTGHIDLCDKTIDGG